MDHILVIEDEVHVGENVRELLEAEHFKVSLALNGLDGIRLAREAVPDLVLCDVMMPEMDGHEVLRELRQDQRFAAVPFLFLTAKSARQDFRDGMDLGADDYLVKPFRSETLLRAIRTRLAKRRVAEKIFDERLQLLRKDLKTSVPKEMLIPLSGIVRFSEVLQENCSKLDRKEIREISHDICVSSQQLHDLIENFMMMLELEGASGVPEFVSQGATGPIGEVVKEALSWKAAEHGRTGDVQLSLEGGEMPCAVLAVSKVIGAVVDNAFRYSRKGTPVSVQGMPVDDCFQLTITNEGRGISLDQMEHIAELSVEGRPFHERKAVGMGLVLSRKIVSALGGEMTIESQSGQKTSLRIRLPKFPAST